MERPFFLTLGGLWFGLLLVLGHALGYGLVRLTRERGWNDFAAIVLMSIGLCIAGVAGAVLDLWYLHSVGFGLFMGTVIFLAMGTGRPRATRRTDGQ